MKGKTKAAAKCRKIKEKIITSSGGAGAGSGTAGAGARAAKASTSGGTGRAMKIASEMLARRTRPLKTRGNSSVEWTCEKRVN